MKRNYILSLALLAILTASCKLGKDYTRPQLNLPSQIRGVTTDSLSSELMSWNELYRDTVLQNLIIRTLQYNKDMLIAAARVKEVMENRRISRADLFPKIDAKVSGQREYDASPDNTYEAKGLLSWELDLWGKLRWGNQAALADYLGTVEGQRHCS